MVSDDGYYSAEDICAWEHADMFNSPRQQCIYEILILYMLRNHIRIAAPSCLDALNILREAAVSMAGYCVNDNYFKQWGDSCCRMFAKHHKARLECNSD